MIDLVVNGPIQANTRSLRRDRLVTYTGEAQAKKGRPFNVRFKAPKPLLWQSIRDLVEWMKGQELSHIKNTSELYQDWLLL